MCSIVGAILHSDLPPSARMLVNKDLDAVFQLSFQRGRDGWGFRSVAERGGSVVYRRNCDPKRDNLWPEGFDYFHSDSLSGVLVGNLRAEPTTEYVRTKHEYDQQPYNIHRWTIAHNGTIANDKDLRTNMLRTSIDSAAIVETLHAESQNEGRGDGEAFVEMVKKLKGSYAILASNDWNPDYLYVAANYRPVWFAVMEYGTLFASSRDYFPKGAVPQMVEPYTVNIFDSHGHFVVLHRLRPKSNMKALVVCSGGLDSVVAATWAKNAGYSVELLHFQYGSRAEGPEVAAVSAVAEALGVPVRLFPLPIYRPEDSPLLQADSKIAGGEAGAEFAHEWVPARNLAMLAIATAVAEAGGFDSIVLGNNLEEAGAYPDNEPEFIAKFNDLLPFAVGDGKQVQVLMPVGNLMKHEIVALGNQLGAPMDKTWSCYRAGHVHCGTCGPCFMRRTAFEINGLPEVIPYAN